MQSFVEMIVEFRRWNSRKLWNRETFWCNITTPNSEYYVASVYHPPDLIYEATDLLDFLSDSCDQLLLNDPNANIVITGDIIKLSIQGLMSQHCRFASAGQKS